MTNPIVQTTETLETKAGASGFDDFEFHTLVNDTAQAAYGVLREYSRFLGDNSLLPWPAAPMAHKDSIRNGVIGIFTRNDTPEDSHKSWLKQKLDEGWKYGPVKDVERKEHPCIMDYNQLPLHHRMKDTIFGSVVRGFVSTRDNVTAKKLIEQFSPKS